MPADVPRDFASAHRMAYMNHIVQIERFHDGREIVSEGVHIVAIPRLPRPTMTAAAMCDPSVSLIGQEHHRVFKRIGAEGPTMAEKDRLSAAPILEVNLRSVFDRNSRQV